MAACLALALAMGLSNAALSAMPPGDPAPILHEDRQATPGTAPGTERWIVHFADEVPLGPELLAKGDGSGERDFDAAFERLQEQTDTLRLPFAHIVQNRGGRVLENLWLVPACLVEIPPEAIAALRHLPGVIRIQPDYSLVPAAPAAPILVTTDQDNHRVDGLQKQGIRGLGGTLAVIDTGLDTQSGYTGRPHAVFYPQGDPKQKGPGLGGSRVLANYALGAYPADDMNGHGTAVAAIAIGAKWNQGPVSDDGHAPEANVVGYSVALDKLGATSPAVAALAWQNVAKDALRHGILVANFSYEGSPDPTDVAQIAMDRTALLADVLPVVSAGNRGVNTNYSPSCANGLSVGAVTSSTSGPSSGKLVAPFSAIGPLPKDAARHYPDLVAGGVQITTAFADDETQETVESGTSFASAQVAGAALLFRAKQPKASALQTKAAILATTEDISARNVRPPANTRMAFGVGYLRDDLLLAAAAQAPLLLEDRIPASAPVRKYSFTGQARMEYGIVLAWNRTDLQNPDWNDLELRLLEGNLEVARSSDPRNLYEKLRYVCPRNTKLTLEVRVLKTLSTTPDTDIALVVAELGIAKVPGEAVAFGQGCPGSVPIDKTTAVLPAAAAQVVSTTNQYYLFGYKPHRYQQLTTLAGVPPSFVADGISFRPPGAGRGWSGPYWVDLELLLGASPLAPAAMSSTFASNQPSSLTQVVANKRVHLPPYAPISTDPDAWHIRVPFDRPYVFDGRGASSLLLEAVQTDSSQSASVNYYETDAWLDVSMNTVARLVGTPISASTGSLSKFSGAVFRLFDTEPAGRVPVLSVVAPPEIGLKNEFALAGGPPGALHLTWFGSSTSQWSQLPLPFDLGPFGAASCDLLTGIELPLPPGLLDAAGCGRTPYQLPAQLALIGVRMQAQALIHDPAANALGVALTGGLRLRIGG